MAILDLSGAVIERVSYDAWGEPRHHPKHDFDGDGDFDQDDADALDDLIVSGSVPITGSTYRSEMDIDRDGDVDSTDQTLRGTTFVAALPKGALSTPGPGSSGGVDGTVGWCGYRYDQPTRLYAVRFRFYDAETFRWLNRDPAGYVDSMNLYGYGMSNPVGGMDPYGLFMGLRTLEEFPELRQDWPMKQVMDQLHESARETRELLEALLEYEAIILREIAIAIATGGVASIVGRLASSVLSRIGPAALRALERLGRGLHEGAELVVLGGIVLIWKGGQWVVKGVISVLRSKATGEAAFRAAEGIGGYLTLREMLGNNYGGDPAPFPPGIDYRIWPHPYGWDCPTPRNPLPSQPRNL